MGQEDRRDSGREYCANAAVISQCILYDIRDKSTADRVKDVRRCIRALTGTGLKPRPRTQGTCKASHWRVGYLQSTYAVPLEKRMSCFTLVIVSSGYN